MLLDDGCGFPKHHKIKILWDLASGLMQQTINRFCPGAGEYLTEDDLWIMDKIINDFVEVDPGSLTFRYPENKQGKNPLEGFMLINIRNLAEQINLLAEKFQKFEGVLGMLSDWQADMIANMDRR